MSKQLYCENLTLMVYCRFIIAVLMMDEKETLIQQRKQYITS